VVPLVAGRRRRQDADEVRQVDLDREPGVGDDPGSPHRPGRGARRRPARRPRRGHGRPARPDEVIAPRRRFRSASAAPGPPCPAACAGLLARGADDDEAWEELEEALLSADVGVATATELVERLRTRARAERASGPALRELLRDELRQAVGSG
jgi:fused signal recognition particle receptor